MFHCWFISGVSLIAGENKVQRLNKNKLWCTVAKDFGFERGNPSSEFHTKIRENKMALIPSGQLLLAILIGLVVVLAMLTSPVSAARKMKPPIKSEESNRKNRRSVGKSIFPSFQSSNFQIIVDMEKKLIAIILVVLNLTVTTVKHKF